jgi:hypothetical protein
MLFYFYFLLDREVCGVAYPYGNTYVPDKMNDLGTLYVSPRTPESYPFMSGDSGLYVPAIIIPAF